MHRLLSVLSLLSALLLGGCGYNTLQVTDETIKSSWSEVINQYQRRADLVPNLVATVKGFAEQEKDILLGVTNARARVGSLQATPELVNDPAAFAKFQAAQGELSSALSRLLVVAENYPQLKSDQNFRDLQAQLEGTENRITVARKRYIDAVQAYNVTVRQFPSNLTAMVFGYGVKANFTVENEAAIAKPPTASAKWTRPTCRTRAVRGVVGERAGIDRLLDPSPDSGDGRFSSLSVVQGVDPRAPPHTSRTR
jgi:LemA protein